MITPTASVMTGTGKEQVPLEVLHIIIIISIIMIITIIIISIFIGIVVVIIIIIVVVVVVINIATIGRRRLANENLQVLTLELNLVTHWLPATP